MPKFKKVRTLQDIKNDPRVSDVWLEDEQGHKSWWCQLKAGYQCANNMQCHVLHENTLAEICSLVNWSIPYPEDPDLLD